MKYLIHWPACVMACSLAVAGSLSPAEAGEGDKVHEIGTGLKIAGQLGKDSARTYKVKFARDKTYVIDMISPDPKALDPFLRLLDAEGKQVAEDDDGGDGVNARIIWKAAKAE